MVSTRHGGRLGARSFLLLPTTRLQAPGTAIMSTLRLPLGLAYGGPLVETVNGGISDWVDYKKVKLYTNAFVILEDSKVSHNSLSAFFELTRPIAPIRGSF